MSCLLAPNLVLSSQARARRLCQYKTPDFLAEFMVKWAIDSSEDLVLDPCCGDSNLLEKAVERLVELGSTTLSAAERIYGVEINRKTTLRASANLNERFGTNFKHLVTMDFLKLESFELPRFNALLCNPPYRRHHDMSRKYKNLISERILRSTGIIAPKTSSLYLHFFIHASQFLADEGKMIFLTPSQYLNNNYGAVLREALTERLRLCALVLFDENLSVFPGVMSTACLTLLRKRRPEAGNEVTLVKTKRILTARELWNALHGKVDVGVTVQKIRQEKLREAKRWSMFFERIRLPETATRNLQDFATIKRGLATGANDFFMITHEKANALGIEQTFLKPVLAKANDAPYLDFTAEDWTKLKETRKKVWLFSCDLPKEQITGTRALSYIEQGEELKYNHRYLTSHRQPWYRLERRPPSKIIFTYMSNGNPRFIYNETEIVTSNAFHCIYPDKNRGMNDEKVKAILSCLNSSTFRSVLPHLGRIYSGGLLKIEPGEARKLPVVDIDQLSKGQVSDLARLFDKLRKRYRENRNWDTKEIDQTIKSISNLALC
ncbi:SAM-dependent methyltransferase [Candidatus Bathyarchaeota archaeon]|nr:SAM-dependent methyltransferase [Candidatus Bathyarchaeota archaeon]